MDYTAAHPLDRLMKGKITHEKPSILIEPREIVLRQSTDALAVAHPEVVKALQYIKDHFNEPIPLEDMGEHAGMSPRAYRNRYRVESFVTVLFSTTPPSRP